MARVGGRNAVAAWIIGVLCAAIVIGLAVLAVPLLPGGSTWFGAAPEEEAPAPERAPVPGEARECRDLYGDALWASLRWEPGAEISVSRDSPNLTATEVVDALAPAVRFTCAWTSEDGEITTTYADVAADAPTVVKATLPDAGFGCRNVRDRVRCTRTDEDVIETVEVGDGRWLSSVQVAWTPTQYAERVADRAWSVSLSG
ncbi:hypothetical protein [Microbacterium sp.]|uniref:hypothetical protein n=1 Tax=Microbacterium sp. TaxID=51671 RepID=UPI003A8B0443